MPDFTVQDLCNLPNYYAVMRANIDGQRTDPSTIKTVLPPENEKYVKREEVVALSRQKYATPKAEAEAIVARSLDNEGERFDDEEYRRLFNKFLDDMNQ